MRRISLIAVVVCALLALSTTAYAGGHGNICDSMLGPYFNECGPVAKHEHVVENNTDHWKTGLYLNFEYFPYKWLSVGNHNTYLNKTYEFITLIGATLRFGPGR